MSQARAPILHLRNARIFVFRTLPLLVRTVRSLRLRSSRARSSRVGVSMPRRLGQTGQKLLRNWRRYRAARSSASPVRSKVLASWPRAWPTIRPAPRQALQHPGRTRPRASPDRSAAGCAKSSSGPAWPRPAQCPQSAAAPANPPSARHAALGSDAFEYPINKEPKVNARRQRRTSKLRRIELRATILDKPVKAFRIQHGRQTLIKRMPAASVPIPYAPPTILLPLSMLPPAHRHESKITNKPCGYSNNFQCLYQDLHHGLLGSVIEQTPSIDNLICLQVGYYPALKNHFMPNLLKHFRRCNCRRHRV